MDALNDDCQLLIISNLSLIDQLTLFEATKEEPTNRLNSNVRYTWQHQLSFCLEPEHFKHFDKKPELFSDYLSIISPTVQELELLFVTLGNLRSWTHYNFPKLRSLEYTLDDDDAECNGDLVIKIVSEIFPQLNSIKPYGVFNCAHLTNWMDLRKLDLSECWCLTYVYECDEIGDLKLLEELIIPNQFFKAGLCSALMRLPKLRTLTYFMGTENDGFESVVRSKDIEKIAFNDSIWEFSLHTLQGLINLRQLTLLEDEGFTALKLRELITALPQLERLDLIDFRLWNSETELWQTVACCPSLKILNISHMQLYADFFDISRRSMEKVLDKRATPLTLHCHDTGKYDDLIGLYFKHPNLKVSFESLKINYIDCYSVQLHFYPSAMPTNEEKTC